VRDDAVAQRINRIVGKRVALTYEEKVGLPASCFGDTRHFVTGVSVVEEIPIAPGVVIPTPPGYVAGPCAPVPAVARVSTLKTEGAS
jgi:hypothetical protein